MQVPPSESPDFDRELRDFMAGHSFLAAIGPLPPQNIDKLLGEEETGQARVVGVLKSHGLFPEDLDEAIPFWHYREEELDPERYHFLRMVNTIVLAADAAINGGLTTEERGDLIMDYLGMLNRDCDDLEELENWHGLLAQVVAPEVDLESVIASYPEDEQMKRTLAHIQQTVESEFTVQRRKVATGVMRRLFQVHPLLANVNHDDTQALEEAMTACVVYESPSSELDLHDSPWFYNVASIGSRIGFAPSQLKALIIKTWSALSEEGLA